MAGSKVYFMDFHLDAEKNFLDRFEKFVRFAGIGKIDFDRKYTAIKIHFGEYGNVAYLRPGYARTVAKIVRELGGIPYATDCNTLYAGKRKNALDHLDCAAANGFTAQTLGCNVIIADGIRGDDDVEIPIGGDLVKNAKIGRAIADSDVMVTMSHFKCHEMAGLGGSIKNMAMGCASRRGKMEQHSGGKPVVLQDKCIGCRNCVKSCGSDAIFFENKKANIDHGKCVGCSLCIPACHYDAINTNYDTTTEDMCKKMAEYAAASIKDRANFHICIISDVSPYCDCRASCELPIVPNIGILASFDPVALDMACADMVNNAATIPGSVADIDGDKDVFTRIHPKTNWKITIDQAVKMGMGTTEYEIVKME